MESTAPRDDIVIEDEENRPPLTRALLHRSATNNISQVAMVGSKACPIESLDYEIIENDLFDQNWRTRAKADQVRYVVLKWTFCLAIGIITGIVGFLINLAVENVAGFKHAAVSTLMESSSYWTAFFLFAGTNLALLLFATTITASISPAAGGSGIPEVKAYLNGVDAPKIFSLKTLAVKAVQLQQQQSMKLQKLQKERIDQLSQAVVEKDEEIAELKKKLADAQACSIDVVKIDEINKELKRLTENLAVMEQSLEASNSAVKLAEDTLQKHKEGFKIKMNEKHKELIDTQAAAKKIQEELGRLVQENKEIDDAVLEMMKVPSAQAATRTRRMNWQGIIEDLTQLVAACRELCQWFKIEGATTCNGRELVQKVQAAPSVIGKWKLSSAIGAARYALAFALSWVPDINLDSVSRGVRPGSNTRELIQAVRGYDTRVARKVPLQDFHKPYGVGQADEDVPADSGASRSSDYSEASSQAEPSLSQPQSQAVSSTEKSKETDTDATATSGQADPKGPAV